MIPSRTAGIVAIAIALVTTGCAVGSFVTGAPPSHSTEPGSEGNPRIATARVTPARVLLARRCSGCHVTPEPASMSASEWRDGLERMKRRMRLPESEWDSLAAMSPRDVQR